jgi:hypothetical protein
MQSYNSLTGIITITEYRWCSGTLVIDASDSAIDFLVIDASDSAIDFSQYEMKPIKKDQMYTDILQIFSEYQDQSQLEVEAEQLSNLSIKYILYSEA